MHNTIAIQKSNATGEEKQEQLNLLAEFLVSGRVRAKVSRATAAALLGVDERSLIAMEAGDEIPDPEILGRMTVLYPIDGKCLFHLANLALRDRDLPFADEGHLLPKCATVPALMVMNDRLALRKKSLLAESISPSMAERKAGYFSIGHLSDHLLLALQDPVFHAMVEDLAREHLARNPDAESPPSDGNTPDATASAH